MGPARSHYEVLGVSRFAETEEIRAAYHDRARVLHPDVADSSDAHDDEAEMRFVNEAWRVLGDADARAEYDQGLRRAVPVPDVVAAPEDWATDAEPEYDLPVLTTDSFLVAAVLRGWPLLLLALMAAIFVFSAYAAGEDDQPGRTPPGDTEAAWEPGECLDRVPEPTPVPCGDSHDAVVAAVVPDVERCPDTAGWFEVDIAGPTRLCIIYGG